MRKTFLFRSSMGIDHHMIEDEDGTRFYSEQDIDGVLDQNKAMATHNDGYTPSRDLRRAASIPLTLLYKWQAEEGWDPFHPSNADKLKAKLNSNEFLYLRTAPGRL